MDQGDPFKNMSKETRQKLLYIWKNMSKEDKEHFINQVTYALACWGIDEKGKELVAIVLEKLVESGSTNLADFGIYVKWMLDEGVEEIYPEKKEDIKKALEYINDYRMRFELPQTPTKGNLV